MERNSSGSGSGSGGSKPRYQAPVILPLGAMAKSVGAACSAGLGVVGAGIGQCRNGNGVRGQCVSGNNRAVVFQP